MCYSPEVEADLKKLQTTERAKVDLEAFEAIFEARLSSKIDLPKALESNFNLPTNPQERRIRELIETYAVQKKQEHEEGIVKQQERRQTAEAKLAKKEGKTARKQLCIATEKLSWHRYKLEELVRVERKERDSRVYPKWYTPVIVLEGQSSVIRPMRYLCRPENMPETLSVDGKPIPFDVRFQGCYNARRDNLDKFWKAQFGLRHAYMVIHSFYEHVELHKYERREKAPDEPSKDLVICFRPNTGEIMKVACVWSHIEKDGKTVLDSVAAVTDEPPPEVSAAGHDRCLVPLTEDSIEVWLRPDRDQLQEQFAALDNRVRPYYEHRLAA